ncbi:OmpA family protein [Gallaecimonas pentaromativorans]|uniref:OmpA family protein n=1 Tax=Gallaecimonas pentaromativorans TaxID=584787 RepID=UPI00067EA1C7|nr:OmpA family protein [Gallaecimonas pentaromativorans]MED5526596.1 OmpA family protein [Pseudomonadota bacterium]
MFNSKRIAVTALAGAIMLAGCTTVDSQTGEQRTNKTGTGAAIGAIAGAILGKATGSHHRDRALVGAAVGALAGAAVGNYMDKQEEEIRQQTAGSGIDVQRNGDNLLLTIPNGITFDVNRADVKPEFQSVLTDLASTLNKYPKTMVEISGHTDSTGSAAYNQTLSVNRADSVKSFLVRRGVMPERLSTVGYGQTKPIASNATAEGRAKNRRVEIELIPIVDNN